VAAPPEVGGEFTTAEVVNSPHVGFRVDE